MVVALYGTPLPGRSSPWLDAMMQFVQVGDSGRPEPLEGEPTAPPADLLPPWLALRDRAIRLLAIRS